MKPAILLLAFVAGCTNQALCQKSAECANDPPGDDYVKVCTIVQDGNLRALRANKEKECLDLADATERLNACKATLDCDDYTEGDLGHKCDDELDDFNEAFRDTDNGGECRPTD